MTKFPRVDLDAICNVKRCRLAADDLHLIRSRAELPYVTGRIEAPMSVPHRMGGRPPGPVRVDYTKISLTTSPLISVRRKSRPEYR